MQLQSIFYRPFHAGMLFLIIFTATCPAPAFAGKLDDFEREATKEQAPGDDDRKSTRSSHKDNGSAPIADDIASSIFKPFWDELAGGLVRAAAVGGENSMQRIDSNA